MARCPFALWKPLARAAGKEDCEKTQIILHTMSGHFVGSRTTFETTKNDSTFMLALDGELHQLMETQKKAQANGASNKRAISIETEDGTPNDAIINKTPWTPEQLTVLVKLIRWCSVTHGIPLVRIVDPTAPGIGYHMMFRAKYPKANPWTDHPDKVCPGTARAQQFDHVLLPALVRALTLDDPLLTPPPEDGLALGMVGGDDSGAGLLGTRVRPSGFLVDPYFGPSTTFTRQKNGNLLNPYAPPEAPTMRKTARPKQAKKR